MILLQPPSLPMIEGSKQAGAMGRNFTRLGVIHLGDIVRAALDEQGWDQKTLTQKLSDRGHITNEWNVSRFLNGKTDKPDGMLILTLAEMEICRNPSTGQPYSVGDLMLIACEEIDPKTGKLISEAEA